MEGRIAGNRAAASRTAKGRAAEDVVAVAMASGGWTIVARNWRRGAGELDIVACRDGTLAFVEVKATDAFGIEGLESSVGRRKRQRIVETSKLFIAAHREFEYAAIRYDVASVKAGAMAEYFENAFAERT
ncbi:MAG: YraN family protein [Spirochaetae bacterium HGW-Spirochaetae-7]|jgi:putative endonuclease|nr:MAG: YraN family protein [Spirochaetae bacterium HGW-Spirochaetae-7]